MHCSAGYSLDSSMAECTEAKGVQQLVTGALIGTFLAFLFLLLVHYVLKEPKRARAVPKIPID